MTQLKHGCGVAQVLLATRLSAVVLLFAAARWTATVWRTFGRSTIDSL